MLAGLLVIAAVAPLRPRGLPPEAVTSPSFDGQPAATLAGALFDYPADTQRVAPDPPPRATLLREPGLTTAALRTLAGDSLTEDTGPTDTNPTPSQAHPTRDSLLSGVPTAGRAWSSS